MLVMLIMLLMLIMCCCYYLLSPSLALVRSLLLLSRCGTTASAWEAAAYSMESIGGASQTFEGFLDEDWAVCTHW